MTPEISTETKLLAEFVRSCAPPKLREIGVWAEDEVVMPSGPFANYPFQMDRLPYSRLLLSELGNWQKHVITGPTQSGKSFHAFVLPIMYFLFERQEDLIVGIPDINMAGDKWAEDIRPVIEKSSYAELLPKRGPGSKGAGKLQKITFENGCFLRFMSAGGNDKQRAAATARVLIVTETDGLDTVAETSQEGQTKIAQLEGRIRSFGDDAISFFECTVSNDDAFTWRSYQNGTASRIFHPCPHCGVWVSPEREHLIGWKDAKDEIEAGENGCFSCPECDAKYSEQDRIEMNHKAKLVHKGQEITPDGEIVGPKPRTNTLGFRWSGFQNLLYSSSKLASDEWLAVHADDPEQADIVQKQQAWCLPVKDTNTEKVPLDVSIVRGSDLRYKGRCCGIPQGEIPPDSDEPTCFIDLSKRVLQWSVEVKTGRRIHAVDYGFHETPQPDVIGDEAAIEDALRELAPMIMDKYPEMAVGLIDCGNWREKMLEVIPTLGKVWRPSHGLPDYKHPSRATNTIKLITEEMGEGKKKVNRHVYLKRDGNVWVVNFDPDSLKHRVHSGFLIKPETEYGLAPGCITLFGDDPHEHTEFAKQVTAEEFRNIFEKGKGEKRIWHKTRRDNHMLDCCVGNMVARSILAAERSQRRSKGIVQAAREKRERRQGR